MNIKKFSGILFAICVFYQLSALEVNKTEIESAGGVDAVVFRNYSGPHSIINTIAEIREIGTNLGNSVKSDTQSFRKTGSDNKYSVIHAVDPSTNEKLDADVFIIGKDAAVDHITNVRRIIAAYLTAAYGYNDRDASTIATFVTVYNAVYRGKMDVFAGKYKSIVMDNVTEDKVGMSTDYQDWPGKSQIIIPLSDNTGASLSSVDTSIISDKEVIKSLQGEDDKSLETRKDMVDLKEREADEASEKAQAAQKEATKANEKLKTEQKKAAAANKEADNAKAKADAQQTKADEAKKNAEANPSDKKAQKEAAVEQKKADEAKQEAKEKQAAADEQNKKTEQQAKKAEEASKEASEKQADADKKRSEAQEERTSIAKDQQTLINEQKENANSTFMYGLKNIDESGVMSTIVKMNAVSGESVKESPVSVIRGRTVYEEDNAFIAIAGTNAGKGAVKLVAIDKESLEIVIESKESIAELSALVERDGFYYCVIQDGANFYVGKYNNKAEGLVKSPVPVKAATPITVTPKGVIVNSKNGTPVLLKLDDLSQVKQ